MRSILYSILLLAASSAHCANLDGTYESKSWGKLNFKPNGTVSTFAFGRTLESPYKIEGDSVKFHFQGGDPAVLKMKPDGSLTNPFMGTFVRK